MEYKTFALSNLPPDFEHSVEGYHNMEQPDEGGCECSFRIGQQCKQFIAPTHQTFHGLIDEVVVYDRQLSLGEVADLMIIYPAYLHSNFGVQKCPSSIENLELGMVGYYKFNSPCEPLKPKVYSFPKNHSITLEDEYISADKRWLSVNESLLEVTLMNFYYGTANLLFWLFF